jgi:hypothetical protein
MYPLKTLLREIFDFPVKAWVLIAVASIAFISGRKENNKELQMAGIAAIAFVIGYYINVDIVGHNSHCNGSCQIVDPPGKGLLPIMDPAFNIREIAKQMILLEDHLFQPRRHCNDCIRKHFLMIEGFAEEAITLDKQHQYKDVLDGLPEKVRRCEKMYWDGEPLEHVGQCVRKLRKTLHRRFFPLKEWGEKPEAVKNTCGAPVEAK